MAGRADLEHFFTDEVLAIDDACTRCGACVEICPVAGEAGVADLAPGPVVDGVIGLLRNGELADGPSRRWLNHCNSCGACVPACPEGINPRRMLMFAQCADARTGNGVPQVFSKLSRAVRLLAAMQLPPEQLARLLNHRFDGEPDVLFYTGCNALRTPHVLLNAMQVLDALDVHYAVAGGPASCCGIAHTRTEGRIAPGGKVLESTLVRFEASGASRVLSWCPSCQLQMGETWQGYTPASYELEHVSTYLLEHADALIERFVPVAPRRVILHAHAGLGDLGNNVARLLDAIPGIERVSTAVETGYTCGLASSARSPVLLNAERDALVARTGEGDVDAVVSLYHSCHRSLLGDRSRLGVPVVNFTDLLVEALGGTPVADGYLMIDELEAGEVESATADFLAANGVVLEDGWFERNLDELKGMAEYRGGLACLGS